MHSEAESRDWGVIARLQGLVCLVCGNPPALQRRQEFYDSGLCRPCAAEIEAQDRREADKR